ncbi:MAG TPA: zinc-binding dehydrogenase [Amycolatopsis sp.]|nr:zinc-binding dehydrogenase [Amycolatopsis sp.]
MRSLICEGAGKVRIRSVPDPRPRPGDALVRIEASAVCGSERATLRNGMDGNTGHEACGIVVEPGTSAFHAGDRVGLTAVTGCGECARCAAGQELHCERGPKVSEGWHAEFAAVPASALRQVRPGIDPGVAAMLTGDPLGVPARALHRAPSGPGDRVLVLGLGPVGLAHVVVRAFTGAEVIGIEPSPYRRDLALRLGAKAALSPDDEIPRNARLVIECTGREDCIRQAFDLVENAGTVLQSGECHVDVPLNPSELFIRREITYTGSWYYATEDYAHMCELVDRGLPLRELCTHDVAAADAQPAITDFLQALSGKVILRWV